MDVNGKQGKMSKAVNESERKWLLLIQGCFAGRVWCFLLVDHFGSL